MSITGEDGESGPDYTEPDSLYEVFTTVYILPAPQSERAASTWLL
jgi:hypothetical protein